jgi:hypothetical protein
MKRLLLLAILFLNSISALIAQENTTGKLDTASTYIVEKNDGTEFVGKILSKDAREVIIRTKTLGDVAIPKHEIKEIRLAKTKEIDEKGNLKSNERFATRYFINTNGLPLDKGESYMLWTIYGPDFQFAVTDNFGVGIMTTWIASPILANAKYSFKLDENVHLGVGILAGTLSWIDASAGLALPFGSFTLGNKRNNISITAGYGSVWANSSSSGGRFLCSISGLAKVSEKVSIVFDSFIMPSGTGDIGSFTLLLPGLRIQTGKKNSFQFGFAALSTSSSGFIPEPIPMLSWFQSF